VRETNLERRGEDLLALAGFWTVKQGQDGFPDRQVFRKASDRVFWIEYKTPTGALSALQRARCRDLVERGQRVYVARTPDEVTAIIDTELRIQGAQPVAIQPATRHLGPRPHRSRAEIEKG
jgi:hypothetical protein